MAPARRIGRAVILIGSVVGASSLADVKLPARFVERPLTLPGGTAKGELSLGVLRFPAPSDSAYGVSLGGAYGVMDNLELGATLLPLTLSPSTEFGNPSTYGTYRFLADRGLELGGTFGATWLHRDVVWTPVRGDVTLTAAASALYHLGSRARLDASIALPMTFGGMKSAFGLSVPVGVTYQITDEIFAGAATGLGVYDFDYLDNTVVPLSVFGGYTFDLQCRGILDVRARFGFPELLVPNAMEGADKSYPGFYEGILEGAWHWGPINCGNGTGGDDPRDVADPCRGKAGQGLRTGDYSNGAAPVPKPPGKVFSFPQRPSTGTSTGVLEAFTFLDFYLGGAGRSRYATKKFFVVDEHGKTIELHRPIGIVGEETDSIVLEGDVVDYIKQQASVIALVNSAKLEIGNDAQDMSDNLLACDQSGTFVDRGRAIVQADGSATPLHLALGTFSVFWETTCEIGPAKCCVPDDTCPTGQSRRSAYNCTIKFTQYDEYNFSRTSGTGNSGWLKALNPVGWFGVKFNTFSYWETSALGNVSTCM